MAQSFRLVSYNILANSYVKPEWYTHIDSKFLKWDTRRLALVEKIESFDADVICLQEVEEDAYLLLEQSLKAKNYVGVYAKKEHGKPDGCAAFSRSGAALQLVSSEAIYYSDGLLGAPNSGHLALVSSFECDFGVIRIAGTHLRWDREDLSSPATEHTGYRQIRELIAGHVKTDPAPYAWIVCGDLNAQPDSRVVKELTANGFQDAYKGFEQYTCNPNRTAKRIDYIFHTTGLKAAPARLKDIDDLTPLPSTDEPSDHLAVMATLASP